MHLLIRRSGRNSIQLSQKIVGKITGIRKVFVTVEVFQAVGCDLAV